MSAFGGIFERAPWIAAAVWENGVNENDNQIAVMHRRMCEVLLSSAAAQQDELIQNHPELAARANRQKNIEDESRREQKNAGLDEINETDAAKLAQLNRDYRAKFGFPFIVAVAALGEDDILAVATVRLTNTKDEERQNALQEICKIARQRLQRL